MTEIHRKPRQEEINNLLQDNLVYSATCGALQVLHDASSINICEVELSDWKRKTRLMFLNYPAVVVFQLVQDCMEDIAESQWQGFEMPRIREKKNYPKTNSNLPIVKIAESYGLVIKGNKACCPFHAEKQPSLTFYPETNSFYCFGCNLSGDAIKFVQLMMESKK